MPFPLQAAARRAFAAYRSTGADPIFGDLLPAHDVAMEGYFWRFTDPGTGRVVIALNGVNRGPQGHWATLGLAAHPHGFLRTVAHPEGHASPSGLGAFAGEAFQGSVDRLRVDLGADARVDVRIVDAVRWPRRSTGGSSVFQAVPSLNQYWHPWLLGGAAHGRVVVGEDTWDLDGWQVYGEKNWGKGGFPESRWWGQAQGFSDPTAWWRSPAGAGFCAAAAPSGESTWRGRARSTPRTCCGAAACREPQRSRGHRAPGCPAPGQRAQARQFGVGGRRRGAAHDVTNARVSSSRSTA